jgi:hypothetical protein
MRSIDHFALTIKTKLMAVTTDSGKNIKRAVFVEMEMTWVFCMAHSINLSLHEGLKVPGLKELVKKATCICTFFRRSPKAADLLSDNQSRLGLKFLKMKMFIKIRWNSFYDMAARMLESKSAISVTLSTVTGTRKKPPPDLSPEEWKLLEKITSVLSHFSRTTTFISQ